MSERACESCATPDDELLLVRRVYLESGSPAVRRIDEAPELWCLSCTSQYPHEVVDVG